MTNDIPNLGLSPQANALIGEFVTYVVPIITAALLALWRRAAGKSKLQSKIIEAVVKGIDAGSKEVGDGDTQIVKKAVKAEATAAGVEEHLQKVVDKVKSETNGIDGGHI